MSDDNIVKIFTASEVTVLLLKGRLEELGITSMIKDNFKSGVAAGFYGGPPETVDLFIQEKDMDAATPVINEFKDNQVK
ncbi:putative signal transducing protein [Natronoflexus pectinivorans]|uniref:Putative signal transducing protein n=1 Tax=Natronoflexus pectinivorans TaxID=682526 RepID=A0A4R2GCH8_9BACT|nr:DUF2007 domain-containing protein [Natronoflexus pectinivorans]TCO04979.1 putative signal transducing protein [Natronoflexus pectinivorans]